MNPQTRPYLLILLFLLSTQIISAQVKNTRTDVFFEKVYFETDKYNLSAETLETLDKLVQKLEADNKPYNIYLRGNTDYVGDTVYNQKLSEKRVHAVKQYLLKKGIAAEVFNIQALGEIKPVADNTTEEGRQKNRRVDIAVKYKMQQKPAIETVAQKPIHKREIFELYKQLEIKPEEFAVNPSRDTFIRSRRGTVIHLKEGFVKLPASCKNTSVTFKLKESFLRSEMIRENLSTTSNGEPLETQGMIYTEALDCNGNNLSLVKGKDMVVFMPVDKVIPDMIIFDGARNRIDSVMNWSVNTASVLSNVSLPELNSCSSYWWTDFGDVSYVPCRLFLCKIIRLFKPNYKSWRGNFANRSRTRPGSQPVKVQNYACESLQKLYEQYGVKDMNALVLAINKPLLDSFGIQTMAQLQDTLAKIEKNKLELAYQDKTLKYDDFKYYVFNMSGFRWANCDAFSGTPAIARITLKVDQEYEPDNDCNLIFKDRGIIFPPARDANKYKFDKVAKGEFAWLVALKYTDGQPYLSMQKITTKPSTFNLDFKQLSIEELKAELKKLDE